MPSRTSLIAGSSDAEKQVFAYVVRVAGMVKLPCQIDTSRAHGRLGRGGVDGPCREGKNGFSLLCHARAAVYKNII